MIELWWTATRPASIVKVVLPILVGLSLGYAQRGVFQPTFIVFALLFGWFDQLLIIFLNDYADAEADTHHTQKYPALIDVRAIPNGWLTKREILVAGGVCAALMCVQTLVLAVFYQRPWAPLFAALAILFLWAYSFRPLRLNYRGLGELLETFGVGGVLPWVGFYTYTGELRMPLVGTIPILLLSLASSMSSGLKHMPADRETGKHTVSVLLGPRRASLIAVVALATSILYCASAVALGLYPQHALVLTVGIPIFFGIPVISNYQSADHRHLPELNKFKGALHKAIYATNLGIALGFVIR
jgi:1,4-dihydroxy-2-naphthoate octaprenyltransferase